MDHRPLLARSPLPRPALPFTLCLMIAISALGWLWAGSRHVPTGVHADAIDWPSRVDAGPAGAANVAMLTDYGGGFVTRIDRSGLLLGRWENDGPAEDIAVGGNRRIHTVQYRSNRLYVYSESGVRAGMVQMAGNVRAVAVEPTREAVSTTVYVLDQRQPIGEPPSGPPAVHRLTLDGARHAEWAVPESARDLYAGPAFGESGPGVTVSAGGVLTRHGPDGTVIAQATLPGATVGLSGDSLGRLYTVLPTGAASNGQLWQVETDGQARPLCELPAGRIHDLAIDKTMDEILLIAGFDLWRLGLDCRPITRYTREALNGFPTPVGGATVRPGATVAVTPTPDATSTARATASATATVLPTATALSTATGPGHPTPTSDVRTSERPVYLPSARR